MPNNQALIIILNKLLETGGVYNWISLSSNEDLRDGWLCRIPKQSLNWFQGPTIVHICDPLKYLESVDSREYLEAAQTVGYARDKNDGVRNIEEFHCTQCKEKLPEAYLERVKKIMNKGDMG